MRASARAGRLAVVAAAGALALAGCGGGGDDGAESPSASAPETAAATTAAAPEQPTPEASQELVDLVNGYAAALSEVQGAQLGPAEIQRRAARLREGSEAVAAKVEEVVAHACVERLALGQAALMGKVADFLQAAADGDADAARRYSQELRATDEAAMLRESRQCQAEVGYRGPEGG